MNREPNPTGTDSGKASSQSDTESASSHNRPRQHLIQEGSPVPFLVATGIMTDEGRVRSRYSRKFRQINRYIEFIADIVNRLPTAETIRVVDFGCGKSYLTFATHYYLTQIAGRSVEITGLECRADVVESCQSMAAALGLTDVRFELGQIADFDAAGSHVHLAISLHACDTATDDALFQAVHWRSDVILAVPCCQHELARQMRHDTRSVIRRHGILNERFCALATDAIRAMLLEQAGYQTQVVEFIDMEHTAKNVMIRAVRRQCESAAEHAALLANDRQKFDEVFALPKLSLERQLSQAGLLSPH